jgi:predicted nucleic acid-binding protein
VAVIVSDTAPLNYLVLIEAAQLLPRLYQRVLIPPSVLVELTRPAIPGMVRFWVEQRPIWLEVAAPISTPNPELSHLGAGEAQAITLALECRADVLLMDERDGSCSARALGLAVTGTLGVLDSAARLGWADLPTMFARLRLTTFRCPVRLMATMLEQDAIRRQLQGPVQP